MLPGIMASTATPGRRHRDLRPVASAVMAAVLLPALMMIVSQHLPHEERRVSRHDGLGLFALADVLSRPEAIREVDAVPRPELAQVCQEWVGLYLRGDDPS